MDKITAELIGSHERTAYTVEHRGSCVLITGAVPAAAFPTLAQLAPGGSVMDQDCARVWGATFAFGPEGELEALRKAGTENAYRHERAKHPAISDAAARWLAGGERGISSNFIFTRLTGVNAMGGWSTERDCHPHDPADFRRCRLLLEQVPELGPLFPKMAEVSPTWARLVERWDAICAVMDEEAPKWREGRGQIAPKTYDLIKQARAVDRN